MDAIEIIVDADTPPGKTANAVAARAAYVERVSVPTDDRMVFESSEVAYRLAARRRTSAATARSS